MMVRCTLLGQGFDSPRLHVVGLLTLTHGGAKWWRLNGKPFCPLKAGQPAFGFCHARVAGMVDAAASNPAVPCGRGSSTLPASTTRSVALRHRAFILNPQKAP